MNQYALVGSKGFIGNALASAMTARRLSLVQVESRGQLENLMAIPESFQNVDKVLWVASKVNPVSAEMNPELCDQELDVFSRFVSFLSSKGKSSVHLVFVSSAGCVYSGKESIFLETSEATGINAYGRLKYQMENILRNSKLSHSVLRVSNVYGPNQPIGRGQGVIAEWISSINQRREVRVYGQLNSTRDYIFIDDLLEAIIAVAENAVNQIFNIGSGTSSSLQDVISTLNSLTRLSFDVNYESPRPTDRGYFALDNSKILRMTNWYPRYSLERGIEISLSSGISARSESS